MKLKEEFPVLYSIAHEKDASVVANVDFLGGTPRGMLSLVRKLMIERWMLLLLFSRNCSLSLFKGGVEINCG
jgi:hypothetical protein